MNTAKRLLIILITGSFFLSQAQIAWGAPYFYITGEPSIWYLDTNVYSVYLFTDTSTLTAAQATISFDNSAFEKVSYSTLASRCNFWSPANPSLGYGNNATPYFYGNNTFVIACGFSNPGFASAGNEGSLIAKFSLQSIAQVARTSSFSFSNLELRYIADSIIPGASPAFPVTIYAASASATPTPAPPQVLNQDVLTLDQISFKEVSARAPVTPQPRTNDPVATLSAQAPLTIDNRIPPAPEFTPRPSTTPYILPTSSPLTPDDNGSVLSIQSLRELLIPGKSTADQTVVLINLISLLTFFVILTILIWRMLVISRLNKIKQRHMKDIIAGELSVLESKMSSGSDKDDMASQLESLKDRLDKV